MNDIIKKIEEACNRERENRNNAKYKCDRIQARDRMFGLQIALDIIKGELK